jgi:SMP-30/gluconolaconase/LRE-like protein
MKVDRDGNLFVTGPKGIWVWDKQGHHVGTIVIPEQPANLAWGDKDYRTLYITATTSVYKLRMKARGFVPYLARLRQTATARRSSLSRNSAYRNAAFQQWTSCARG